MRRGGHSAVAAAAVWAAVSSIAASVVVAPAARAQDFTVGGASAGAESVSLTATQGGTGTIGFTFGVTSASYRDSYASSAAKPLDLGLLTVLFGEGSRCIGETGPVALPAASLPAAFEANSLQGAGGGSAEGESSYPGLYGATPSGPVGRGTAAAAAAPSARASTTIPVVDVGLVSVANPVSETEVKVDAGTRVAVAESRADKLVLLGGVVTLDHPVWRAEARSGSSEVTKATFTTKGGTLFGQPRTAAESVRDLRGWADLIKNLVGFVGIRLDVPDRVGRGRGRRDLAAASRRRRFSARSRGCRTADEPATAAGRHDRGAPAAGTRSSFGGDVQQQTAGADHRARAPGPSRGRDRGHLGRRGIGHHRRHPAAATGDLRPAGDRRPAVDFRRERSLRIGFGIRACRIGVR
jgi:hypothetical protein